MTRRLPAPPLALVLAWLLAGVPTPARADDKLDPGTLKKVKSATVHFEVTLPGGEVVEGSGFFTDEPGVVLTNAHVLGMLNAESRPPRKVAITVNSGEADSRTVGARLLGVDRNSDLAVLRAEGKDFPEPLKVVSTKDLKETEEVYAFGFPLGKRLGKNITIAKTTVTSLRKENGRLNQIQVNGGIDPGNSGGPVVNGRGEVVGVAVSGITGTQLRFAIPGEKVHDFLNGSIVGLGAEIGYIDGDAVRMPFRLSAVDPLGRLKDVAVETWTGPLSAGASPRFRPDSTTAPKPVKGDSEHKAVEVKYEKQPETKVELALPRAQDAKTVYWIQASYVNGTGQRTWYRAWAPSLAPPVERKEVTLAYKPPLGRAQLTELTNNGTFRVQLADDEHSFTLNSKSLIAERTAAQKAGAVVPIHVTYNQFTLGLSKDNKPVKADEDVREDVNNLAKFFSADVEMDQDGNLAKSKIDVTKVPRASREFAGDIGEQLMQGLELTAVPLPKGAIKPLQTWNVPRTVELGPAGIGVAGLADIKYTYLGTNLRGNREVAFLNVSGTVKGVRGAGLNVGGTVTGSTRVAVDTGEVVAANLSFKADADVELKSGGKARLIGTLDVQLRRGVPPPKPAEKPAGK
jgi:S1-C subfamily serine protease